MKKFLAIFVVFTLIAGVAFADTSFGGSFGTWVQIANGHSEEDDVGVNANFQAGALAANLSGDNWGANVQFSGSPSFWWYSANSAYAFAWWKPIEQFRIKLGRDGDGDWGAQAIGGWGFTAEAQDYVAFGNFGDAASAVMGDDFTDFLKDAGFSTSVANAGFYGGFSARGIGLSIYPVDGVTIGIGIPYNDYKKFYDAWARMHITAAVQIGDIGKLNLSFVGGEGLLDNNKGVEKSPGNIYASFNLTAIENVGLELGLDFPLPYTYNTILGGGGVDKDIPVVEPIKIGLGASYSAGDFGVKFAAGLGLPGSYDGESTKFTQLGFQVLPYINLLDGALTAYLNAGLEFFLDGDNSDNNLTGWFVNPYIKVPFGLNFYAGLKIGGAASKDDSYSIWAIPIGFQIYF